MKKFWLGAVLITAALRGQVTFRLEIAEPRVFRQSEVVRLKAEWPEDGWAFAGFVLDPPAATCGTRAQPCIGMRPGGVGFGIMARGRPDLILNDAVPVLAPGRYRVTGLLRKQIAEQTSDGTIVRYAEPPQYAASNPVDIQIQAADAEWIREQVERKSPEQLQYLDEPIAWRASLDLLPLEEGKLLSALMFSAQPAAVCELMQERIPAPAQYVSSYYLDTAVQACARAAFPPVTSRPGAAPQGVVVARMSPFPPAFTAAPAPLPPEVVKSMAFEKELREKVAASLAASWDKKQNEPKLVALLTLLEYLRRSEARPAWAAGVFRAFPNMYLAAEPARRSYLLDLFSQTAPREYTAPLLEGTITAWKPGGPYEPVHAAIRELSRLDPKRGREFLIAELAKPKTWLDAPLLDLLPAADVPPMDDTLMGLAHDTWNVRLRRAAIAKYGTARILPDLKAIQEAGQGACQPELLAYFLRIEPEYADRILHSHAWDMGTLPPSCTVQYFEQTAPLAMHPVLEKYMAAYLNHGVVFVKMLAARSLGKYGSSAAREPLWGAYRYFHQYWDGKAAQLDQNGEGVVLEVELRNALARGTNWFTTKTELETIASLCISYQCRRETQGDLRSWQAQPRLEFFDGPLGMIHGSVGHYIGLQSLAAMRAKLAQFPKGTVFVANNRAATELGEFAKEHGFELVRQ